MYIFNSTFTSTYTDSVCRPSVWSLFTPSPPFHDNASVSISRRRQLVFKSFDKNKGMRGKGGGNPDQSFGALSDVDVDAVDYTSDVQTLHAGNTAHATHVTKSRKS